MRLLLSGPAAGKAVFMQSTIFINIFDFRIPSAMTAVSGAESRREYDVCANNFELYRL